MMILGIETSCDDTGAAILREQSILSNIVSTQIVHKNFGGIVPELASRAHIQAIVPVVQEALNQSNCSLNDVDGIAVTYGPGLAGSLLVGLSVSKGLAQSLNIPFIGVNHLEGHIWANKLVRSELEPPFIVLIVSGGHTQLVYVKGWGHYQMLGRTRDDAAGEAFDKVGKLLNLGFPGGPVIEKTARDGRGDAISFPRAFLEKGSLDFSFSGLKTAVLNHVRALNPAELETRIPDIARCFQDAVVDVLVQKTISAAEKMKVKQICLAGGVAVNGVLQKHMKAACDKAGYQVFWPTPDLCADNGAMIARTGLFYLSQQIHSLNNLNPVPTLNFTHDAI